MPNKKLSTELLLETIVRLQRVWGITPSIYELTSELDVSKATIYAWLRKLRKQGYVTWEHGMARTLKVVRSPNVIRVPFKGNVS